jgi:hypothetical protein
MGCRDDEADNDDNTTGPSVETMSFPLAVGNWWTYNEYSYDAETETQGELTTFYKLEVVEKTNFKGKEAYKIESNIEDNLNGSYLSNEDGNFWVGGLTIEYDEFGLTPDWLKFYDAGSRTWEVMKIEFSQNGSELNIVGTGSYQGETSVIIKGQSYNGIKFRIVLKSDVSFNQFGEQITKSTSVTSDYIFVDGVGLYKIKTVNEGDDDEPDTVEILTNFMVN